MAITFVVLLKVTSLKARMYFVAVSAQVLQLVLKEKRRTTTELLLFPPEMSHGHSYVPLVP